MRIRLNRLKCLYFIIFLLCIYINITSSLSGKQRRALRAIANRLKSNNQLDIIRYNINNQDGLNNLNNLLNRKELVLLKVDVDKKKQAKEFGIAIAQSTNSELVQTVGHTLLLFKSSDPPNVISDLLVKECSIMTDNKESIEDS